MDATHRRPASGRISTEPASAVQSIERALHLLRAVVRGGRTGRRLIDLARECGLSKSTTHRILSALVADGLVEQDRDDRLFRSGLELFRMGAAAGERFGVVEIARPALVHLAERSGDTTFLSVPSRHHALCVDRQAGATEVPPYTIEVGDRRPLGIGSGGLALLATRSDDEVESAIAATRQESASRFAAFDAPAIRRLVGATRRTGFALIDGEIIRGLTGIGVPVRDAKGHAIAAVSVTAQSPRLSGRRRDAILHLVREEVRRLEERIVTTGRLSA